VAAHPTCKRVQLCLRPDGLDMYFLSSDELDDACEPSDSLLHFFTSYQATAFTPHSPTIIVPCVQAAPKTLLTTCLWAQTCWLVATRSL